MVSADKKPIPFNRPYLSGEEFDLMRAAIDGGHISGDGDFTKRAHGLIAQITGVDSVLLTTSCTHALEMTALLLELAPGDEVIVPSFTFVSTVNAVILRGAIPVFVDIRLDTLNMDESKVEELITPHTRAIVVVHYAGVACEMDAINEVAARHGIAVVEDAAHGFGGTYHGRQLGNLGQMAALSFHETKNIQCGEGGALLLNDPRLVERAEILREKGTNRSRFFRGEFDKYTWVDVGSSYLPSDLLAAFLCAQLGHFDEIQAQRMHVWSTYDIELSDWAARRDITRTKVPQHCEHPGHLYYLLLSDTAERERFIAHMADRGVKCVFHYVPLHSSPMGRRLAPTAVCPITEDVSSRLVRLPVFAGMSTVELERVVHGVRSFE